LPLKRDAEQEAVTIELREVVWLRPVVVRGEGLTVRVSVVPRSETEADFDIYSVDANEEETLYSQGRGCLLSQAPRRVLDLSELRRVCAEEPLRGEEIYALFSKMGLNYGFGHRGIEWLQRGEDEIHGVQVLARLEMPSTGGEFVLHPGMLDSALQAAIGLSLGEGRRAAGTPLPFALSSIVIYRGLPQHAYAWVRYSEGSDAGDAVQKLHISVCDEQGEVCAELKGFSSRLLPAEELSAQSSEQTVLWQPQWRAAPMELVESSTAIAEQHVFLVGRFSREAHEALAALLPQHIDCRRLSVEGVSLASGYTQTAAQLLEQLQQLLSRQLRERVLVQVIVPPQEECFAGLSGLLKSGSLENPKLITQCIELTQELEASTLSRIIEDNARDVASQEIRYRQGEREVKELQEVLDAREGVRPWKDEGVYLISGGLGGLGLIFARDIGAHARDATVILTGRSAIDEHSRGHIEALQAQGLKIDYQQVDVTNQESVRSLFGYIESAYGRLTGIVHAAGVIRDNFIIKKTVAELEQVLAPKVAGLINLDEGSQGFQLEQFICFASVAGALGNVGQADYAAGNAFMDAYARYRNRLVMAGQRHGQTLSIDWPLWLEGGMQVDAAVQAQMSRQGLSSLPT
jgi:polyketide synthase PksN